MGVPSMRLGNLYTCIGIIIGGAYKCAHFNYCDEKPPDSGQEGCGI